MRVLKAIRRTCSARNKICRFCQPQLPSRLAASSVAGPGLCLEACKPSLMSGWNSANSSRQNRGSLQRENAAPHPANHVTGSSPFTGAPGLTRRPFIQRPAKPQLFFEKRWCPGADSNHRHADFQSAALPTELPGHGQPLGRALGRKGKPLRTDSGYSLWLRCCPDPISPQ